MTEQTIVDHMADLRDFLEGVISDAGTPEAVRDKGRMSPELRRKCTAWENLMKRLRQDTGALYGNCVGEGIE